MNLEAFKPLNLATLYQGADQAVAQAMQTNLLVMQAGRMKKEFDTEDALRDLAKNSVVTGPDGSPSFDLKSFTKASYAIDPMKAIGFEKAIAEADKATLERTKTQTEIDEKRMEMGAKRLKAMNEASTVPFLKYKELTEKGTSEAEARAQVQPLYQSAVQNLMTSGIFPQEHLAKLNLPSEFDPVKAEAGMRQVLGAKDSLAEYWKGRDFKATEGRDTETRRHNQATEKQARDALSQSERHHLATQEAAGNEVKQNEDGTWVVIDKKTKTAQPVIDRATGKVVGAGTKALTEVQGNALAYSTRMDEANEGLEKMFKAGYTGPGVISRGVKEIPIIGEVAANVMTGITDPKAQEYWQAARNFVTATLRKESGAAISSGEFKTEYQKYFPQPGDTDEVLATKAKDRRIAIESMKKQVGPNADKLAADIKAKAGGASQESAGRIVTAFATEADAQAAAKAGKIKSGDKIKVGDVTGTWQ